MSKLLSNLIPKLPPSLLMFKLQKSEESLYIIHICDVRIKSMVEKVSMIAAEFRTARGARQLFWTYHTCLASWGNNYTRTWMYLLDKFKLCHGRSLWTASQQTPSHGYVSFYHYINIASESILVTMLSPLFWMKKNGQVWIFYSVSVQPNIKYAFTSPFHANFLPMASIWIDGCLLSRDIIFIQVAQSKCTSAICRGVWIMH